MTTIMTTAFEKNSYGQHGYNFKSELRSPEITNSTIDNVFSSSATQQLFSKTLRKPNTNRTIPALPEMSGRLNQTKEEPLSARSYESSTTYHHKIPTKTSKHSISSTPLSFRVKPEPIDHLHNSSVSTSKRPSTPVRTRPVVSPFENQNSSKLREIESPTENPSSISRLRKLEHNFRITSGSEPFDVGSKLEFAINDGNRKIPLPIEHSSRPLSGESVPIPLISLIKSGDLEKRTTGKPRGLVGLRNLGNTCFMNSCLQCLVHCEFLVQYFNRDKHSNEINKKNKMKGHLATAFGKLAVALSSDVSQVVSPSEFKNIIEKYEPRFSGYNQHDSQEFLRCLLDGLHEDLNRVIQKAPYKEEIFGDDEPEEQKAEKAWQYHLGFHNSFIFDVFCGQLQSAVVCETCNHKSSCFDPFLDLSVPIPKLKSEEFGFNRKSKSFSLDECLQAFTEEEVLSGKEKVYCSKCKTHRSSKKKLTIYKPPPILVVHLKRFYHRYSFREKILSHVSFPLRNLDIGKFCSEGVNLQVPLIYDLFATSNHMGTLGAGHYIANCKNYDNGNWYNFDDSVVSQIDADQIENNSAYILFYQRRIQKS